MALPTYRHTYDPHVPRLTTVRCIGLVHVAAVPAVGVPDSEDDENYDEDDDAGDQGQLQLSARLDDVTDQRDVTGDVHG